MPITLSWLPVLSHIEPLYIQREYVILKLVARINKHPELPIHQDEIIIFDIESRKPLFCRAEKLVNYYNNNLNPLHTEWHKNFPPNGELVSCSSMSQFGTELPRKTWVCLNHIRTGQERCNQLKQMKTKDQPKL